MTASAHKKFLFDQEFGTEADDKARAEAQSVAKAEDSSETPEIETSEVEEVVEAVVVPTFSEEDLAQAREEGRITGRDEATRDMAGALEQRLADTLDTINTKVANLFEVYAQDKEERSRDAIAVATVIVRKLFPALNMDKSMAEIEHIIVEAMKRTSGSPTLIIKVPEDMHADVEAKTAELAALRGREGTISVIADKDMAAGDISIEWDGGGMMRETAVLWREIDQIIERNLGQAIGDVSEDAEPLSPDAEIIAEPQSAQEPQEPIEEVVKQAAVSENEENAVESPLDDENPDSEPEAPGTELGDLSHEN